MTTYCAVVQILDDAIGGPEVDIGRHGAFWRGVSKDDFVQLVIYGQPVVVVGNASESSLVRALRGSDPFDGALFPQMPVGFPNVPEESINAIETWINDHCPD